MQNRKFCCYNYVCLCLLRYKKVRKTEWQNYVHIFDGSKQRVEYIHNQSHCTLTCSSTNAQNSYLCKGYLGISIIFNSKISVLLLCLILY